MPGLPYGSLDQPTFFGRRLSSKLNSDVYYTWRLATPVV
jgi:hypothetical protein